jgi:hypothetical protein
MHFGFNNKFVRAIRTIPIFQKFQKKYFVFFLVSGITNSYIKRIPDLKNVVFLLMLERLGFYPIR